MTAATHGGGRCSACRTVIRKGDMIWWRDGRVLCSAARCAVDVSHVKKMARDLARPKPGRALKSRPSVKDERRQVRRELRQQKEAP